MLVPHILFNDISTDGLSKKLFMFSKPNRPCSSTFPLVDSGDEFSKLRSNKRGIWLVSLENFDEPVEWTKLLRVSVHFPMAYWDIHYSNEALYSTYTGEMVSESL